MVLGVNHGLETFFLAFPSRHRKALSCLQFVLSTPNAGHTTAAVIGKECGLPARGEQPNPTGLPE